jgi:FkbM family methyltransferase
MLPQAMPVVGIFNINMDKTIFDIGMHTGRDTEFYLKKGFKVVAVEANPFLVEKATLKFKREIEAGELVIIDKAIAPKNIAEIDFYINTEKDDWGTILPDWNRSLSNNFKEVKVKTTQLESLISTYGTPYYMKIDIEGADVLCLKSLLEIRAKPDFISIELLSPNNLKGKKVDCLEILALIYAIGYRTFQIADQSKNHALKCPNPSSEGNYVDFEFGGDTSGLFGKELNSPVYSIDELSKMYLDYFYNSEKRLASFLPKTLQKAGLKLSGRKQIFHKFGWFDVHAS